jgi:hypothetical protein
MYDPMTVAHEIKYPWWKYKPWPKKFQDSGDRKFLWRNIMTEDERKNRDAFWDKGYRETFMTIWHVDPEKDGTDDSCGYSYIKLSKAQLERLRNAAWSEGQHPHFLRCAEKEWNGSLVEVESLYRGLSILVDRVLDLGLSWDEICSYAAESTHIRNCFKAGSCFCFVPGYHTNFQKDDPEHRQYHFHGILCNVARSILTDQRPWWKHPKWHFWHWKFQCEPLLSFKRWAFSRCCKCGKRFRWEESPVTHQWDGTGPLWFRSEKHTMHERCSGTSVSSEPKNNYAA